MNFDEKLLTQIFDSALKVRTDAVEEVLKAESTRLREFLARAKDMLKGLPDLARGLCRVQYGKVGLFRVHDTALFDRQFSVRRKN